MELRTDRYKLKEIFPDRAKKYAQKLHVKADEIEYVRKGIPIDPSEISIEEGERAAIRLITTPRLDRDGEILIPDGAILDDFRQSPSVLFGHQYDRLPVGKDVWIKPVKKGILAKTVYATHQFAEDDFQCVKGGFLNSNSVGFIPLDRVTQSDTRFKDVVDRLEKEYGVPREEAQAAKAIYTKWLLLEHSDVPVASNTQSLNLAVSKGELILDSKSMKEELGIKDVEAPVDKPETHIFEAASQKVEGQDNTNWTGSALPLTDNAVQPKIDFCERCGTALGEIVTKPETTEHYHRIPVSTGHEGHRIRTITISADKGIKALYCGECKEVVTYLFDVDRFTMAEAEAWVEEHGKEFSEITEKQSPIPASPDLAAELASLRQDVAAILARLQVTPEPIQAVAPLPAPPPTVPEEITIDAEPEIEVEDDDAQAPEKSAEELVEAYIKSGDFDRAVAEAVKVAIAKLRGRVI